MNLWKSPTGKERVNNPFGYREQEALEQFDHFALAGFHDASRYGQAPYYIPLYDVYMKDGEYGFQYYYNGEVSIVGAKGMKVPSKAYRNNLSRMSKSELLDYCKKNNIPCASGWDKDQILDIIDDVKQSRYGKGGSLSKDELTQIADDYSYATSSDNDRSIDRLLDPEYTNTLLPKYIQSIKEWETKNNTSVRPSGKTYLELYPKFAGGGSTAGWHRDRKFVDKGAKHEVRYAKSHSGRSGYKSNEEFGVGGGVRTNSKEVREKVRKHILDSVYDYEENQFPNFQDASQHLTDEFKRVADHPYNLKRFPNNQKRFQDYLQGIPFNFEFENYKIEEFLNGLGINPTGKEYSSDKMWHLYSYLIWREVEPTYQSKKFSGGGSTGSKVYNEMSGIGSSKYVVNYHDGKKTHNDGSAFFDIKIFKSKIEKDRFINKLKADGYKEKSSFGGGGTTDNPKEPIAFETSNLYFNGKGMDINGNKVVRVSFPNSRAFSIQTNGNLPKTHSMSKGGYDEKEINQYVKEYGSDAQKKKLKCY